MVTLNDLERDFPEAFMKGAESDYHADDMWKNLNELRDPSHDMKSEAIKERDWVAHLKGSWRKRQP